MKFSIDKESLINILSKAQNIVEKRNTMPILVNVLLEAENNILKIFATDLEVSLTDSASIELNTPGKVAVNAKNFFDIIRELPDGKVSLTKKNNNWLEIKQKKSVFNIVGIPAEEYPVFPTFSTKNFISIDSEILLGMIERTLYSVSNDETRYHLNGVYFETKPVNGSHLFRMVATDGHRLSLVDRESNEKTTDLMPSKGIIIPRKGLIEIRKMLEGTTNLKMAFEGSQLVVRSENTTLMVRLIEGKYPNYQQLIPQKLNKKVNVNREVLLGSIKRVSLLSNQKSKGVTLSFSKGKMEITSNNPELGDAKEEIEVTYAGDDFKIGFNAKYVMDILGSFHDETVDLQLESQLSPGLLQPESDKNYTCVIMPMRI